jgi:ubiquinone/menaquinone biosynthesis C-methylase UbiE
MSDSTQTNVMHYDEDASRTLEAMYSSLDVALARQEIIRMLDLSPGARVLDAGSGPGFFVCELAEAVGSSGSIVGVDISPDMISIARRRIHGHPLERQIELSLSDTSALPFPENSFDAAISIQVLEYVVDVRAAISELYRVIRPGGRLIVQDTDTASIVWHSSDDERMARVLAAWDEHASDPHLPRVLVPLLREVGFQIEGVKVLPMINVELTEDCFSFGAMNLYGNFAVGRKGVTREEVDAWKADLHSLGAGRRYLFSLNRFAFLATKP